MTTTRARARARAAVPNGATGNPPAGTTSDLGRLGTRLIVIGTTCTGKSTLAQELSERGGLAFVELDALYWEPGWTPAARDVFQQRVRDAIAAGRWVIAGNYTGQQQEISWPQAQTIIWLDLPLRLVLRRVVQRSWQRSRSRELLWGTNRERFWEQLRVWRTDDSLISFAIKTHRSRRRRFEQALQDPRWTQITFIRLRSRAEVADWLCSVG